MNKVFTYFYFLMFCLLAIVHNNSCAFQSENQIPDLKNLIHSSVLNYLTSLPTDYEEAAKKARLYRDLQSMPQPIFDFRTFNERDIKEFVWRITPPHEAPPIKNVFDPRKKITLNFVSEDQLLITASSSSDKRCINIATGKECAVPEILEIEQPDQIGPHIAPPPFRPSILKPRPIQKITVTSLGNVLYTFSSAQPIRASCLSTKYKRLAVAFADGSIVIGRNQSYQSSLLFHVAAGAKRAPLQSVSAIVQALHEDRAQLFTPLSPPEKISCIQILLQADALQSTIELPIQFQLFIDQNHTFSNSMKKLNEYLYKQNIIERLRQLQQKSLAESAKRTPTRSTEKSSTKRQRHSLL